MRNKYLVVIMMLVFAFSSITLTACGSSKNNGDEMVQSEEDPTLGDDAANTGDEGGDIMGEFRNMLTTSTDPEDFYSFYETNAATRQPDELDEIIGGIFGMVTPHRDVDFTRLSSQSGYMSDEMRNYVGFMSENQETPFVDDEGIHASLDELLEHSYALETHLTAYPEGVTYPYAYEKYCELLNTAITGGFDEQNSVSNNYVDSENANMVDGHAIDSYAAFIEKYPESRTAKILTEYMTVLTDEGKEISDNVKDFYRNIYGRFEYYFSDEYAVSGNDASGISGNGTDNADGSGTGGSAGEGTGDDAGSNVNDVNGASR